MSITAKAFTALGMFEGLAGVFAAAVTGDPSPAIAGLSIGIPTMVGGIALDETENNQDTKPPAAQAAIELKR